MMLHCVLSSQQDILEHFLLPFPNNLKGNVDLIFHQDLIVKKEERHRKATCPSLAQQMKPGEALKKLQFSV